MWKYFPSTDKDMQVVEKNVRKKSLNTWYEAQLLTDNGKSKRVYCYISPRVSHLEWVHVHVYVCIVTNLLLAKNGETQLFNGASIVQIH